MTAQEPALGYSGPEGYTVISRGQEPREILRTMLALCYLEVEHDIGARFSKSCWKRIRVIWDDVGYSRMR